MCPTWTSKKLLFINIKKQFRCDFVSQKSKHLTRNNFTTRAVPLGEWKWCDAVNKKWKGREGKTWGNSVCQLSTAQPSILPSTVPRQTNNHTHQSIKQYKKNIHTKSQDDYWVRFLIQVHSCK